MSTLVDAKQAAGNYTIEWDARGFASGIYYYTLSVGDYTETRKMVLLR